MNIQNKTVLVLGGWGLVGSAVVRRLVEDNPKRIIITSLKLSEAEDAVSKLENEFPHKPKGFFIPWGGDIFVRNEFKDENRAKILSDKRKRNLMMKDIMEELSEDILKSSSIYRLLTEFSPEIIIDCNGVGYYLNVSLNTSSKLPEINGNVKIHTILITREDSLNLYGFFDNSEKDAFKVLISISGIGPKAALAISSLGTMSQLRAAIDTGDAAYFSLVKGIGQKKIQRIILELTGKLKSIKKQEKKEDGEVIDALVSLGFSQKQAKEAASLVPEDILSSQERVKLALQAMKGSG